MTIILFIIGYYARSIQLNMVWSEMRCSLHSSVNWMDV